MKKYLFLFSTFVYVFCLSCDDDLKVDEFVFIGDSHVLRWDLDRHFTDLKTVNRGISGEKLGGVSKRLKNSTKIGHVLIIQIGTNDIIELGHLEEKAVMDSIRVRFDTLLSALDLAHPNKTFLLSIIPLAERKGLSNLPRIYLTVNNYLKNKTSGNSIHFIDLTNTLSDDRGFLNEIFTTDGVHLNTRGYKALSNKLRNEF